MTESSRPAGAGTPANQGNTGHSYLMVAASSGVAIIATLISGILLARLLSVEDRGLVALVLYWAGFAAAFGNLSLHDAFVFRDRDRDAQGDTTEDLAARLPSLILTVLGIAIAVIAIAVSAVLAVSERFAGASLVMVASTIAAFVLINHTNMALVAVERSSLKFARLAIEQTVLPVLYSALLIGTAFTGALSVEAVLVIFLISRLPMLLVRLWRYRREIFGPVFGGEAKLLLKTGVRFHGVALARAVSDQADKVIVSAQWSATNIAYFAVGHSAVGAAYSLVSQALNLISLPVASKLSADEIAEHFTRSLRITAILLVAVMAPLAIVAPALIPFVFGERYQEAALVTQVLAFAMLPMPLMAQTDAVLRARGLVGRALRMHLIALALLAAGWLVTGYADIVALGLGLLAARVVAFVVTLASLGGDLKGIRLLDCLIWRPSDFGLILRTVGTVARRILRL